MNQYLPANITAILEHAVVTFRYSDIADILIVSFFLYGLLILLKRTHSFFILGGIVVLLGTYLVARFFNLHLTSLIFQAFFSFFAIIFVIIFQKELRNFFEWLSTRGQSAWRRRETISEIITNHIIQAVNYFTEKKIGALIVFPGEQPIERFLDGGIGLDGKVSVPLLLSIFDSSSPGHDGAVIIEGNRIKKFAAHLPLAENFHKFEKMGTRHRAALGLAERSDALVIVVSEERGTISSAYQGELRELKNTEELEKRIVSFFRKKFHHEEKKYRFSFLFENLREKGFAFIAATLLWFIFVVQFGAGTVNHQFNVSIEFRSLPQEYVVERVTPEQISVTLSGRTQDFKLFSADDLKVRVRVGDVIETLQRIKITEDMITTPPGISVVTFTPKNIQFQLKKRIEKENQ